MTARGPRYEARLAGKPTYWTGAPCRHGHVAERVTVNGQCAECGRISARKISRRRYDADPAKAVADAVAYRARHLPKVQARVRKWAKAKRAADPAWKLKKNLRTRIYCAIVRGEAAYRSASAIRDLGCTVEELKAHLEVQFVPGMTWENYGAVWEVDHDRPLSAFDLTDPEQQRAACRFTNLQPLFVTDNRRKGGIRQSRAEARA